MLPGLCDYLLYLKKTMESIILVKGDERMKRYILLVMLSMLVFVGCSNDEDAERQVTDHSKNDTTEQEREPIEVEEKERFPLTGIETDEVPTQRFINVMVNNHPRARPQSGLSQADMVFEILSEGQTTRLMAMFHSEQPEVVGPVRSARPYYFNLADDYNALYVYHGAATFIENMLKNGAADHLNGAYYDNDRQLFKRESFRVAPHNSYVIFDAIAETAKEKGYEMETTYEPLTFLSDEEMTGLEGNPANEVTLYYGNESVRYVYQSDTETYHRYNGQSQTVELSDSTPIALDNVFILETYHEIADDVGRREIDFSSGGDALLIQKGVAKEVAWENRDGRIIPVQSGEAVGFVPGKTWINVIPTSTGIERVTVE